jgi:hypothetical protein
VPGEVIGMAILGCILAVLTVLGAGLDLSIRSARHCHRMSNHPLTTEFVKDIGS